MKKLLASLFALSTVAFAAIGDYNASGKQEYPQYYSDDKYNYSDGVFTINANYMWSDFARRIDFSAESERTSKTRQSDIKEFGIYLLDADGNKTGEYITLYSETGKVDNSLVLQKDQKIGVYMDIERDVTTTTKEPDKYNKVTKRNPSERDKKSYYVIDSQTGEYRKYDSRKDGSVKEFYKLEEGKSTTTTTRETARYTTTATGDAILAQSRIDPDSWQGSYANPSSEQQYFCIFLEDMTVGKSAHYEYYSNLMLVAETPEELIEQLEESGASGSVVIGGEVVEVGEISEKFNTGRPLPGVLTTILIGGAVAGFGKRFGKKRQNAAK